MLDYWEEFPPSHEVGRISLMATTTWKPAGAEKLTQEAMAANNRFASATMSGGGPRKGFAQLPPFMQSAIMASRKVN